MGVLRGYDPFMNLVVEDAVEEDNQGEKRNLNTVVNILFYFNGKDVER